MKTKRMISVLLVLLLIVPVLAGCVRRREYGTSSDKSSSPSEEKLSGKIVVWIGDAVKKTYEEIAADFEEKTGVKVEIVPFTGLAATDKLALDGPSGKGGDVYMQGSGGALGKAVEQGLFMELRQDKMELDRFTEGAVDGYIYKGKLYGLPTGLETPALIYNKKLISSIPDNWDSFIAETKKLTDLPNDKYGFLMDISNPYFTVPLFDAEGGYVFKENNGNYDVTDIGLNNAGSKKVFKMLKGYIDTGVIPNKMSFDVMQKKFTDGKCAVIYDGPWSVNNYTKAGIEIGIAPLPKFANGNYPRVFSGAYGLSVSAFAKNPNAAVEFIKFATTKDNIMKYFDATKRIPPIKEALELDIIKNDSVILGFAEQSKHSMPQPNVAEMDMIWGPMMDGASLILTKNEPVDATFDKSVQKIKESISTMKK